MSTKPLPDELRPFVLDFRQTRDHVILDDPQIPHGENWLRLCETATGTRFLSWFSDAKFRYHIPTTRESGIRALVPRYDGHWRWKLDDDSDLPWPEPVEWDGRQHFVDEVDRVELVAYRVPYRGYSDCRICSQLNGRFGLRLERWEWPEGFRHDIIEHGVPQFEAFVCAR